MKLHFLHLIIFISTILALGGCSDDIEVPEQEQETYESIAIVYWMGDNTLGDPAYGDNTQADINELVTGKDNIPSNSKIVIYVDKVNAKPIIYQLDATNGLKVWKQFTKEEDCTDSLTMLTNLTDIVKAFPAKKYGLIFGAHGSGMIMKQRKALGPDHSHNTNWMNIPTLRGVLEQLPHMSYIFFDVCFMQCIEVAYELRNQADWIIGSPAEIPGPGAPYQNLTKTLCEGDAFGIVEKYNSYYPIDNYEGTLLSAVKCSELDFFASYSKQYIKNIFSDRKTISTSDAEEIQKYSSQFSSYTYCYDIKSAMHHILPEEDYNSWAEAFEKTVPLHKYNTGNWTSGWHLYPRERICYNPTIYDKEHFGGISMYIPQEGSEGEIKNNDLKHYQWYKAAGWDQTGW